MRGISWSLMAVAAFGIAACDTDPTNPGAIASREVVEPSLSKGQAKVNLCHVAEGGYVPIAVAAPAVPAHSAHGDLAPGVLADHSGTLNADCTTTRVVLDASTTTATGLAGGGGGSAFNDACPAGYAAAGVAGNRGNYFGWAALWNHRVECREVRGDGTLGATASTPPRGPLFGITTDPYAGSCAAGELLTGMSGTHDWNVSSLAGNCATVASVLTNGAPGGSVGPFAGMGVNAWTPWSFPCGPGRVVTGTYGSAGDILDSVGFLCTTLVEETT